MARKIKFALEMADGVKVRSNLEELREHFDLEKVVGYFLSGKLVEWLEDRYYDTEVEALKAIDRNASDLNQKLCAALGVEYNNEQAVDVEQIERLNEKKAILRQKTEDENIIAHAGQTAFTQEDLAELLDMGESTIYLCGNIFTIPIRLTGKTYVGILGTPQIKINVESMDELYEKNIHFENVILDEKLQPSTQSATSTNIEEEKSRLAPNAFQSAQKLLQDIQNGHFEVWKESLVPFLEMPFSNNKGEIEQELEQAARSFQSETWDVLHDEVQEKISILKELQKRYDDIFENQNIEYIPVEPDARTIFNQLEFALADVQSWNPPMALGRELINNARYEQMESAGFSGIFEGTDYFLNNDRELMEIAEKYYRLFEKQMENSAGGKMVTSYLACLRDNLKKIITIPGKDQT